MASIFDVVENPLEEYARRVPPGGGEPFVRSNRAGDMFGDQIKRGFGASSPPSTYDAEVRARIGPQVEQMRAQMRAGGTPTAAPAATSSAPVASATPKPSFGARLLRALGGRIVGGLGLGMTSTDVGAGSDVVRDAVTGEPFKRGTPIDPTVAQRVGIEPGRPLTPEQVSAINMSGQIPASGAVTPATVSAEELAMGERNYERAVALGAQPTAPSDDFITNWRARGGTPPMFSDGSLDPRLRRDASGRVVRSPATVDQNGNIVIDTARVGQVAAEERVINEEAFPRARGARGAAPSAAGGVDPYFAPFGALIDVASQVGAQRTANRAVRETAVAEAKARAESAGRIAEKRADAATKPIAIETLTGKGAIVGDTYYSVDAKGKLTATRVPTPSGGLRPGLDPALVMREAKAEIAKNPGKRSEIIRRMTENGYSTQGL